MKKMHLVSVLALSSIISAPAFAASSSLEGKIGVGSVKAASNKAGFDAGLAYSIRLERFFALVPEVNFNWLSYDNALGGAGSSGFSSSGATPSTNFYTVPVFINGRLYIPMGSDETPVVQPIVTVGAGYGWTSLVQSNPTSTDKASGFMYQGSVGVLVNLGMIADGSSSSTNLLFEVGYRGGSLAQSGGASYDWSGYTIRAGVNYAL